MEKYKCIDIEPIVDKFVSETDSNHRYTSYDYCHNYFINTNNLNDDLEKSCMVLFSFLSSWGMLRGSSFLLGKSYRYFIPIIKYLSSLDKSVWKIDVDKYSDENIELIIKIYNDLKRLVIPNKESDLILITKIMLGVFGFIPAFDTNFCKTFKSIFNDCGFTRINKKSLHCIKEFYESNKSVIDNLSNKIFTIDFNTEQESIIHYSKAKIIDMYGFTKGLI